MSKLVTYLEELRTDQSEREAIAAEAGDVVEPAGPKTGKRRPPPEGVWEGTLRDLNLRDIPEPVSIASLGRVPVTQGAKVVLYGPPSSTKTLVAFRSCLQVAMAGGRVWILEGEGHEHSFRQRLNRIAFGLDADGLGDAAERVLITHKPFVLEQGVDYWKSRLEAWKPDLVCLDPLVDFTGADENSTKEMRAYLRLVQIATDQYGCAVIVCHHSTKPSESGRSRERGSGSIKGWADVHISVHADDAKRRPGMVVARMRCEKGRDLSTQPEDTELRWHFEPMAIRLETTEAEPEHEPEPKPDLDERRAAQRGKQLHGRQRRVVELLAKAPLSKKELRDRLGISGARLNEALEPLFAEERVHIGGIERVNLRGEKRVLDVVKLGAAPLPLPVAE